MRTKGPKAAETFLTAHALDCTTQAGSACAAPVDDLMYRFLVGDPELGRSAPPRIAAPAVPDASPGCPPTPDQRHADPRGARR
jgi:hypothetical protein